MNLSTEEGRPERFSGGLLTVAAFEAMGVQPIRDAASATATIGSAANRRASRL